MRVRLAIVLLVLAAAPAVAQDAGAPAALRPSVKADAAAPAKPKPPGPAAPVPATPAPPPSPAFSPIPSQPTAEQCRTTCARDYYFCLAQNEVQDCAPTWSQCRLTCGATGATTPVR